MSENKTIGKVLINENHYSGEDRYSDGQIEDTMLEVAREGRDVDQVIRDSASWEMLYHFSPQRENTISWLPVGKDQKVLEVGSGCGAVTGALCRMAGEVTAVDLSEKRSMINAYRHQEADNLTIHVGNFQDIEPDLPTDYDWIFLVGVFVFITSYMDGEDPYTGMLEILKKHLGQQGKLVIAIESLFGLKYWAGCREDHVGDFFAGLEGYPRGGAARTFTRKKLEEFFARTGYLGVEFYYPYPDYKFMHTIYSDDRLPMKGELSTNLRNFDGDRFLLFDEKLVFDNILEQKEFPLFANSYVAVASPGAPGSGRTLLCGEKDDSHVIYCKYSTERAPKYRICTRILEDGEGNRKVQKVAMTPEAAQHLKTVENSYRGLVARYEGSDLKINTCTPVGDSILEFEYLEGKSMEEALDEALVSGNREEFQNLIRTYQGFLEHGKDKGPWDYDLIFQNLILCKDGWYLIDYEWTRGHKIPAREIAFRAWFTYRNGSEKRTGEMEDWYYQLFGIRAEEIEDFHSGEEEFQKKVLQGSLTLEEMRVRIGHLAVPASEQKLTEAKQDRILREIRIYPDFGKGFEEETSFAMESVYRQPSGAGEMISFHYMLSPEMKAIRIDPGRFPCMVSFLSVKIDGKEVMPGKFKTEGRKLGTRSFCFANDDPWVYFKLAKGGNQEISVEMELVRLGKLQAEQLFSGR